MHKTDRQKTGALGQFLVGANKLESNVVAPVGGNRLRSFQKLLLIGGVGRIVLGYF
jgi:hypothetical protein